MAGMSASRWMDSSAKIGSGLRSVIQALSSIRSLGMGCSTMTTPCSASQWISSSAFSRSVQPWFASTASGRSVISRIVRIISSSFSRPTLTFRILKRSAHSRVFSRTTSGVSMPMVKVVSGALAGSSPQSRNHGWPISLPTKSCKAMSTAALAAVSPGERLSTYARMSSSWNGSENRPKSTFSRNEQTLSTVWPRYGGIEASP